MRADVRALIDWATAHGWTNLGMSGSGHYRLRYTSGVTLTVPNTPSDSRSMPNTWADLARLTGQRPYKPRAARYRHTGQRAHFTMEAAARERERHQAMQAQRQADRERRRKAARQKAKHVQDVHARHARAVAELRAIGGRVAQLAAGSPERSRALRLIARCLDLEAEAERLGAPVPVPVDGGS
ncbi:hypothetical protein [Streptomyces sp. NPDC059009]|uniref:hypothetical protein n=1 Tax=Streptomyces sp. NPDC059009 TaxID=3346694 RepID=UPI00367BE22C